MLGAIYHRMDELPPIIVLRPRNMTAIDATGLLAFEDLADKLRGTGRTLIVCGAPSQPRALMRRAEFERRVGRENICDNVLEALARAKTIHAA